MFQYFHHQWANEEFVNMTNMTLAAMFVLWKRNYLAEEERVSCFALICLLAVM